MIYSTNRTASLGDMTIDVNESYFGAGALTCFEEAAQDELDIFENAIKSDIDEVMIGESADELAALNEGFVQTAVDKIKELMKKFMEWLEAVSRSAIAKLTQLVVRDNAKFCKIARKQIAKMKPGKFEAKGKVLTNTAFSANFIDNIESDAKKAYDNYNPDGKGINADDLLKQMITDDATITLDVVQNHLEFLEKLDSKTLSKLRKLTKTFKADAKKIAKDAESKLKSVKEDDKAGKEAAQKEVEKAAKFKQVAQANMSAALKIIKRLISVARAVVAKAMGATPKNEAYGWDDEDLATAMLEAMDYEYDETLEEMSEACKKEGCEDCDSDDDDDLDDED